jgi:hypothetical protein
MISCTLDDGDDLDGLMVGQRALCKKTDQNDTYQTSKREPCESRNARGRSLMQTVKSRGFELSKVRPSIIQYSVIAVNTEHSY